MAKYDVVEQIPKNIEELKKLARTKTSYQTRLTAIHQLRKYKCPQSINILWQLMMRDKVYAVQEEAFRALQRFDEKVKLPRKKKGHLVKGINKLLEKVNNSFKGESCTIEEFKDRFKTLYPTEFDIYSFEKKGKMDTWIKNILASLPSRNPPPPRKDST